MTSLRCLVVFAAAGCLAQPAIGQGLETAARDAQRYVDCVDARNIECLRELTHPDSAVCDAAVRQRSLIRLRDSIGDTGKLDDSDGAFWRVEISAPAAIESGDERLFVFVPLRLTFRIDQWGVISRILLGVSENDGESWRFLEDGIYRLGEFNLAVPGQAGPQLPAVTGEAPADPQPVESQYLLTREAGFVPGVNEGEASVRLGFDAKGRIRNALTLYVAFANPRAPIEPIIVSSVLLPGQETLSVSSPLMTGLLAKQYYEVVVFGLDADTDEVVFEHRQFLRYFPVRDYFDEVIPAIAGTPTRYSNLFAALAAIGATPLESPAPVATTEYAKCDESISIDSTVRPLSLLNTPRILACARVERPSDIRMRPLQLPSCPF